MPQEEKKVSSYSIRLKLHEFCENTTAHGPPRIVASRDWPARLIWSLLFVLCLTAVAIQTYFLLQKFTSREKLLNIEIKFDNLSFPAITLCNLNPFKNNFARQKSEIHQMLELYEAAMARARQAQTSTTQHFMDSSVTGRLRPRYATCKCDANSTHCSTVEASRNGISKPGETTCLCFYNSAEKEPELWPCLPSNKWQRRFCVECTALGSCPIDKAKEPQMKKEDLDLVCYCANELDVCIAMEEPKIPKTTTSSTTEFTTTSIPQTSETVPSTTAPSEQNPESRNFGFQGTNDTITLTAKAQEHLLFATAQLSETEFRDISMSSVDLISQCVYNGQQCFVHSDFSLHLDPSYGACYTFNPHAAVDRLVERPGRFYGLRVQLNVDRDQYLPTTESVGVRVSVHDQQDQPFPDTLGYSAPVGFLSSFGLRLRHISRLSGGGDCRSENENLIFRNKSYSIEACERSCMQHELTKVCGCGDPRYPQVKGRKSCAMNDWAKRQCLSDTLKELASQPSRYNCKPACMETHFVVSFSSSQWPASANHASCPPQMTPEQCLAHAQRESAVVEIFYEQLGYELYTESVNYGPTNLVADFGGTLGLWMGISVVTCMEFLLFLWNIILPCFRKATTTQVEPTAYSANEDKA